MEKTCQVIDVIVSLRISSDRGQKRIQDLGHRVRLLLAGDRKRHAAEAGTAVETLLTPPPPPIKEVWCWINGLYKTANNRPTPRTHIVLEQTTAEQVTLYQRVPPPRGYHPS